MDRPDIPDERLRLMFACAHPAIDPAARAPLMLQTVLGLDATSIASAFLISPTAMSQRLVRAKTRIREAGIPFKVPEPSEFGERLGAVLEAIYAAYDRFYKGDIAAEIARGTQEQGGLITKEDLAKWQVRTEEPVQVSYKGIDVYKLTVWTQGPSIDGHGQFEVFQNKPMGEEPVLGPAPATSGAQAEQIG